MELNPDVEAVFEFVSFRKNNVYEGYRPAHLVCDNYLTTGLHHYYDLQEDAEGMLKGTIVFVSPEAYPHSLWIGKKVVMYEGAKIIGYATITQIFNPILDKGERLYNDL